MLTLTSWSSSRQALRCFLILLLLLPVLASPPTAAQQGSVPDSPDSVREDDPDASEAMIRLGSTRYRSVDAPRAACFIGDGSTIATLGETGVFTVWDLTSGRRLREYSSEARYADSLIVSADRTRIACADNRSRVLISEVPDGRLVEIGTYRAYAGSLAFSPDGRRLAFSNRPGFEGETKESLIRILDIESKDLRKKLTESAGLTTAIAFAPDGETIYSAVGPKIRQWDLKTGQHRDLIERGEVYVSRLAVSPDGRTLAWSERFQNSWKLFLQGLREGSEPRPLGEEDGGYGSLRFSPDGKALAYVGRRGAVHLMDVARGEEIWRSLRGSAYPRTVEFSPGGETILVADGHQSLRILDARTGRDLEQGVGHRAPVRGIQFDPSGKHLVTAAEDGSVLRWDLASEAPELVLREEGMRWKWFSLSADARICAVSDRCGRIRIRDILKGTEVDRMDPKPPRELRALFLSPTGRYLAWRDDGRRSLRVRQVGGGEEVLSGELLGYGIPVALRFSPEEKALHCLYDSSWSERVSRCVSRVHPRWSTVAWDLTRGSAQEAQHRIGRAWYRDGHVFMGGEVLVVAVKDGVSEILDAQGRGVELSARGKPAGGIRAGHFFSHDGRLVAVWGGRKNIVSLHDVMTGTLLQEFQAQEAGISGCAFAADSRFLAVGGNDGTVWIYLYEPSGWEAPTTGPPLDERTLSRLWEALGETDGIRAERAVFTLEAAAPQSVPFLAGKLRELKLADPGRLRGLIQGLDDDSFHARQTAEKELSDLDWRAEKAVREALQEPSPHETKHRLTRLLRALQGRLPLGGAAPILARRWRALAVLERIGSPEAQGVLEEVLDRSPIRRERMQALAALRRVRRRDD